MPGPGSYFSDIAKPNSNNQASKALNQNQISRAALPRIDEHKSSAKLEGYDV